MSQIIPQILFIVALIATGVVFGKRALFIVNNIRLGKAEKITDNKAQRWKNMILFALGQKKMFQRPIPALLHMAVYIGFVIINIEVLEIVLDGITGKHRIFESLLGPLVYGAFISIFEVLAVAVIVSCGIFLIRRNVIKLKRFLNKEMDGWPKTDANLILIWEIVLMIAFLVMDAADIHHNQHFLISSKFSGLGISSIETLHLIERACWWFHILGIFGFAIYVTYSKHLHIFLAFPNSFFAKLTPNGEMRNMPEITREVKMMLDPSSVSEEEQAMEAPTSFGARDVRDLSWKTLLDAYSCTECGRCTSACPANVTGKELSPRKVMMDTRDRLEEVGRGIAKEGKEFNDGKSLLGDYITVEELNACTTCQACVQECPVSINPLNIIQELRRCLIMEDSNAPAEWNLMFSNIENNFAPWQFSPEDRLKWADED